MGQSTSLFMLVVSVFPTWSVLGSILMNFFVSSNHRKSGQVELHGNLSGQVLGSGLLNRAFAACTSCTADGIILTRQLEQRPLRNLL
jgi:hypothetical protein